MEYRKLGSTSEDLSVICLGTMTWGEQNTQAEGFEQMDYAFEQGVNFFDTAELYSIPGRAETYGSTEKIIGNWFSERKNRDKVFLASKVAGRNPGLHYIRGEEHILDRKNIMEAVEGSLQRLKTDYIDLYQLHWPDRRVNNFGHLGYLHVEGEPEAWHNLQESLEAMSDLVKQGKVRYIGISNETPWGFMQYLNMAKEMGLERIVSIQNPYSLLNRSFEVGHAEISLKEKAGLLAYSPLGFGLLTGKYRNGAMPKGSRLDLYGDQLARYNRPRSIEAAEKYCALAEANGMTPTQMSLAWVNSRPFVTSNIIGATNMEQLKENIGSIDVKLSEDVVKEIELLGREFTFPAP